jgi:hypothetical protein
MNSIKKGGQFQAFHSNLSRSNKQKIETNRDPNTPDFFIKMTDAQRHLFANKMSEMPEMGNIHKVQKAINNLLFVSLTCFYNLKNSESFIQF